MKQVGHAFAVAIGAAWIVLGVLVLKHTCDTLPAKSSSCEQANCNESKPQFDSAVRATLRRSENQSDAAQESRGNEHESQQRECEWCAVNWAQWIQNLILIGGFYVAYRTLASIEKQANETKRT